MSFLYYIIFFAVICSGVSFIYIKSVNIHKHTKTDFNSSDEQEIKPTIAILTKRKNHSVSKREVPIPFHIPDKEEPLKKAIIPNIKGRRKIEVSDKIGDNIIKQNRYNIEPPIFMDPEKNNIILNQKTDFDIINYDLLKPRSSIDKSCQTEIDTFSKDIIYPSDVQFNTETINIDLPQSVFERPVSETIEFNKESKIIEINLPNPIFEKIELSKEESVFFIDNTKSVYESDETYSKSHDTIEINLPDPIFEKESNEFIILQTKTIYEQIETKEQLSKIISIKPVAAYFEKINKETEEAIKSRPVRDRKYSHINIEKELNNIMEIIPLEAESGTDQSKECNIFEESLERIITILPTDAEFNQITYDKEETLEQTQMPTRKYSRINVERKIHDLVEMLPIHAESQYVTNKKEHNVEHRGIPRRKYSRIDIKKQLDDIIQIIPTGSYFEKIVQHKEEATEQRQTQSRKYSRIDTTKELEEVAQFLPVNMVYSIIDQSKEAPEWIYINNIDANVVHFYEKEVEHNTSVKTKEDPFDFNHDYNFDDINKEGSPSKERKRVRFASDPVSLRKKLSKKDLKRPSHIDVPLPVIEEEPAKYEATPQRKIESDKSEQKVSEFLFENVFQTLKTIKSIPINSSSKTVKSILIDDSDDESVYSKITFIYCDSAPKKELSLDEPDEPNESFQINTINRLHSINTLKSVFIQDESDNQPRQSSNTIISFIINDSDNLNNDDLLENMVSLKSIAIRKNTIQNEFLEDKSDSLHTSQARTYKSLSGSLITENEEP